MNNCLQVQSAPVPDICLDKTAGTQQNSVFTAYNLKMVAMTTECTADTQKCTHPLPKIKPGEVKDDGREISWSFDDTSEYVPGGPKSPPPRLDDKGLRCL